MNTSVPLDIRNVSYSAGQRTILDSIEWTVRQGEHWVILGPNGSGKTTLLKMACGYLWPNQGGTVYRNGSRRVDLRELRKGIGWVTVSLASQIPARERALRTVVSGKFAQIGLLEMSTVRPVEEDFAQAEGLMGRMGCLRVKDQAFGTLSQGEQQKVLISRALMARPYLMFLDEPCAGLDPGAREGLLAALQELGRTTDATALVYVTHHIEEILPAFEKTLVLKGGRVFRSGETGKVITEMLLRELYETPLALRRSNGRYWTVGA
ncbi:MAG: ATP-binding cassette domain-containing protein [Deltaproteobacteria bacterium]|nr:ATP-binding cassette domain-containing protein [Deltaproteobacteria bacterium]MDE0341690.1 ATP-binding cassette domain-containing protein [Deltaproteobacteria bacterium]